MDSGPQGTGARDACLRVMPRLALLLGSLAIVAACSAGTAPPQPVAPLPAAPALVGQAACRIAGPHAMLDVTVEVDGDTFPVEVRGAPVVVLPGDGPASTVAVEGTLAFVGRVDKLVFFPATGVEVADGIVELGPKTLLQDTAPRDDRLVARTVDIGGGLTVSDVDVPCAALSFLGSGDPREELHVVGGGPRPRAPACAEQPWWCVYFYTPATLDVFALPGDGAHVRLAGGSTIVAALEYRGRWTRIATVDHVHLGAQLTGWVEHRRLGLELAGGFGFSGNLSREAAPQMATTHPGWGSGARVFHGMVHVDAGTPVLTRRDGGTPWARVLDRNAEIEAVIEPGSPRARVLSAPSLPDLPNAWVPVGAVHGLPATDRVGAR
jgi:hypothetical protein